MEASRQKLVDASEKGAEFLTGGTDFQTNAALQATVITNLKPEMAIFDDEAFGPSVSLYIAQDDAHAVRIANNTAYGLSAAIHTQNMHRALTVAHAIDTAQIHVNSMTVHDERKYSSNVPSTQKGLLLTVLPL